MSLWGTHSHSNHHSWSWWMEWKLDSRNGDSREGTRTFGGFSFKQLIQPSCFPFCSYYEPREHFCSWPCYLWSGKLFINKVSSLWLIFAKKSTCLGGFFSFCVSFFFLHMRGLYVRWAGSLYTWQVTCTCCYEAIISMLEVLEITLSTGKTETWCIKVQLVSEKRVFRVGMR